MSTEPITIQTIVKAPLLIVWEYWNEPEHINNWAYATDTWEAYGSENDARVGGKFKTTMAAKDKSSSFDFSGTYTDIKEFKLIEYTLDDDRKVRIEFLEQPEGIKITQTFEPEKENPRDMQRDGWQAMLDNFKKYTESKNSQ